LHVPLQQSPPAVHGAPESSQQIIPPSSPGLQSMAQQSSLLEHEFPLV
jgi:hypothetical protein